MLFRFCSPFAFPPDQVDIPNAIFNDPSLSCDWRHYRQDPATSFHVREGLTRIIEIDVCDEIRNPRNPKRIGQKVLDWHQDIYHDPLKAEDDPLHGENPAHSLIDGKKKLAVRDSLVAHSSWYDLPTAWTSYLRQSWAAPLDPFRVHSFLIADSKPLSVPSLEPAWAVPRRRVDSTRRPLCSRRHKRIAIIHADSGGTWPS